MRFASDILEISDAGVCDPIGLQTFAPIMDGDDNRGGNVARPSDRLATAGKKSCG